ncbi:MAG: NTE family protein [Candidatus Aldehydirespiratoraceae bacterium]|jgi:NTE family protein
MLIGAALLGFMATSDVMGAFARFFEQRIGEVEVRLFGVEFGVTVRHVGGKTPGEGGNGSVYRRLFRPRPSYPLTQMFSIGLVLSAGGPLGDPWHSGVLGRLEELTGWDARTADLIVGTSAGSITAVTLRAGVSAIDRKIHFEGGPVSPDAQTIYDRITTPYEEPEGDRNWRPSSPKMALKAAWPPWKADPVRIAMANLPRGTKSGESLEKRMNELMPDGWPDQRLWITAVRMSDGRRVVFGRDDIRGNIGQAVRSSAAVPGVYTPGLVGEREYVDGGVHSSTNLDLAGMLGFDLVVVSSAMTAVEGSRSWISDPTRAWFSGKLDDEVAAVRARGTAVLVVEPDADTLPSLDKNADNARPAAVAAGAASVDRVFADPNGEGLRTLLERGQSG